jgi:predicted CoA-binding protein
MSMPDAVHAFLQSRTIAVAGVSRQTNQAANAVFRKLKKSGYQVYPINPNASQVEGVPCYKDLASIPVPVEGVVVATPPAVASQVVDQAARRGVRRVWFHRSFGEGSVSEAAIRACRDQGLECIVGGCPLMFCEPVDFGHRCMRWWLQRKGRVPR